MINRSTLLESIFFISAAVSALLTAAVFVFLFIFACPLLMRGDWIQLITSAWLPDQGLFGIYPMMIATLLLAILSLAIAFPMSLGTSMVIVALAPLRLRYLLLCFVRFMTAIPTVVYSFAAMFILVPFMRNLLASGSGMSLLTAAPVLALLIAPTLIIFFVNSFQQVPAASDLAPESLGASPTQKLIYVILPQAWPGILMGLLLGFARATGDTMISLMLAGNSAAIPESLTDSARTLTAHIALVLAFDFDSMEFKSVFLCGLILYLITAVITLLLRAGFRLYGKG